jgi:3-oxoacyl-[acyl-carrier protein] reductase
MSRTILTTGASKGIGRAIAERLAGDGFSVVVHVA